MFITFIIAGLSARGLVLRAQGLALSNQRDFFFDSFTKEFLQLLSTEALAKEDVSPSLCRFFPIFAPMDATKGILDFFVYLAPSLLVFMTAWILINKFLDRENRLKMIEMKMATQRDLLPLRLQAYERLTLYLERISPNVLLLNNYEAGTSVAVFQQHLLHIVRSEFEHNFSQQIYVTPAIWTVVRNAKEDIVRLINASADALEPDAPAHLLSQKIFEAMLKAENFPTQRAITYLKNEVSQLF